MKLKNICGNLNKRSDAYNMQDLNKLFSNILQKATNPVQFIVFG
jgi:hypothetical protein